NLYDRIMSIKTGRRRPEPRFAAWRLRPAKPLDGLLDRRFARPACALRRRRSVRIYFSPSCASKSLISPDSGKEIEIF
ncbi:MAG TPA: hypothetical protein VEH77_14480, partial [Roseiarcus sp.]|nr:hypothetical protein [Roseiarcus sp.]